MRFANRSLGDWIEYIAARQDMTVLLALAGIKPRSQAD
jgi:hypothetical protein